MPLTIQIARVPSDLWIPSLPDMYDGFLWVPEFGITSECLLCTPSKALQKVIGNRLEWSLCTCERGIEGMRCFRVPPSVPPQKIGDCLVSFLKNPIVLTPIGVR